MKNLIRFNVIYLIILLSIFSNSSSAQDITGKWVLSNLDMVLLESATTEQKTILETKTKPMMDELLPNFTGKMSLEFNPDGTFIFNPYTFFRYRDGHLLVGEAIPEKGIWNKEENKLPTFLNNFDLLSALMGTFTKGADADSERDDNLAKSNDIKYEVVDGKLNLIAETDFMICKAVFVPK